MTFKQLFLLFIFTLFSYANETSIFTQNEQDYLKEKKEITVCFSPKGLPLLGYKKGNNIGIFPEVMSLIEKKIPIPVRHVHVETWEECIALSREKKVDISAMIITTPNRHKHLIPSKKVINGYIGIATKIKEPLLNDSLDLNSKKVALLKGQDSIVNYVKLRFPKATVMMVNSIEEGLNLVAKGKIYGYIDETYSLAYYILNLYSNELKIMDRLSTNPISGSVGVHKDEPQLLNMINKAIDSIDEQEIRDIIHKWIAVHIEKGFDYRLLMQIAAVFLLVFLVSLYWIRRLLREVKRREIAEKELKVFNKNLEKEISNKVQEIHYKDAMLLEKTKLAAMGEMLGSIAHQWRRPLSTLHINIEMLEEDYNENKIDALFLEKFIKKNSEIIQYMSHTIDDFQNFYKIDKEKRLFDVMEKIQSVSDLKINQLEESGIRVTKEGESFTVLGYPSEFQQVILNLVSNAKDALLENKIKNPTIEINLFSDDSQGYIKISDNAGGIDIKTIEKIFQPYYTTKEQSGGTGLGLYISKMIIERNMQGALSFSNNGKGSDLLITLKKEDNV